MFLYETHLHTKPVSRCAEAGVSETVDFYKQSGYKGVFITNHFLDGNINADLSRPYEELIEFYFSDFEHARERGKEVGLDVFQGVEISVGGTDFLIYGLDKAWYLAHPECILLSKTELLTLMAKDGALIIHAHPFREAGYIDHIRLWPRKVHGVEIYNANRTEFENRMAALYAENYGHIPFAGTDNHVAAAQKTFGGVMTEEPVTDEKDFAALVLSRRAKPFKARLEGDEFVFEEI